MRFSVSRSAFQTVRLGLLLASLLGGRDCDTFPLGEDYQPPAGIPSPDNPRVVEALRDLKSLERSKDALKDGFDIGDKSLSSLEQLHGEKPTMKEILTQKAHGVATNSENPRPSWGTPRPVADRPNHDDDYADYEETGWGHFLPFSSSSERETEFSNDYYPLGGGVFTSEVLDPSITHNVFGGLPPDHDGSDGVGGNSEWQVVPSGIHDPQINPKPLNNVAERPSAGISVLDLHDQDADGSYNGLNREPGRAKDELVSNLLSSILSADGSIGSNGEDNEGTSFPDVSPDTAGQTGEAHWKDRQTTVVEKDQGAISGAVAAEKPAGNHFQGTTEDRNQTDMTEDDVIDTFLDFIFSFLNRLVTREEKNQRPVQKRCV